MSDVKTLEPEILSAIAAANDEAALESVRVGALGKSGSVSALLKTLGGMTPEQRKEQGPLINGLRDRIAQARLQRLVVERQDFDGFVAGIAATGRAEVITGTPGQQGCRAGQQDCGQAHLSWRTGVSSGASALRCAGAPGRRRASSDPSAALHCNKPPPRSIACFSRNTSRCRNCRAPARP